MKVTKVTEDRWQKAQEWELATWLGSPKDSEDWNGWWYDHFKGYEYLNSFNINSILEVGCGPYGKNVKYLLSRLQKVKNVDFLDPLINEYINNNYSITNLINKYNSKMYDNSLEELKVSKKYDCILCINVLDHVKDADACMEKIEELLNEGGVLILGQDLTNEEDVKKSPYIMEDIGHPIKLDHVFFKDKLKNYKHIFQNILKREHGRNPEAHYGTLIYVGQKV